MMCFLMCKLREWGSETAAPFQQSRLRSEMLKAGVRPVPPTKVLSSVVFTPLKSCLAPLEGLQLMFVLIVCRVPCAVSDVFTNCEFATSFLGSR